MARLIFIVYRRRRITTLTEGSIEWEDADEPAIEDFPQICWDNGEAWAEANLWAAHLVDRKKDLATILSVMINLLTYANWLESSKIDWWHFPDLEIERCLYLYHDALKKKRKSKVLAASTTTQRMNVAIRFYKWMKNQSIISELVPANDPRVVGIRVESIFGFNDTVKPDVISDLKIQYRSLAGAARLEDGVLPVSAFDMQAILKWLDKRASRELFLLIYMGFWTGLRLESMIDLKIQTLENAYYDEKIKAFRLSVGPLAEPPVATKNDKPGKILISASLLHELQDYCECTRRLLRQRHAHQDAKNHLFLTRFGQPYNQADATAIHVAVHRLRKLAESENFEPFFGFHMHRTRATFATELMRAALNHMSAADAVAFVREALMHKDDKTTFEYVTFIQSEPNMAKAFDGFTEAFMGTGIN